MMIDKCPACGGAAEVEEKRESGGEIRYNVLHWAVPPDVREALRTVCDAYAYVYCTPDADRAVALIREHFGLTDERTEP